MAKLFLLFAILFLYINCRTEKKLIRSNLFTPKYEIGTWRDFTDAAVSYTWDDNTPKQLSVAKPLFNNYGFKTTFFVTTNWVSNWFEFQIAADNGHEVASHSVSHPNFGNIDESQRINELEASKNTINTNINGNKCVTIAYPFCAVVNDGETEAFYISGRTCQGLIENSTPSNLMQVSSIPCGTDGPIKTSDDFTNKVKEANSLNGWVVFLLHGIDNDGGYSPIKSTELDTHLNYMSKHKEDFWVATYGEVVKYIKERDTSILKEIEKNDNQIVFNLTNELENNIYNVPLSIKITIPTNWLSASIKQKDNILKHKIIEKDGEKSIILDIIPNSGLITITKSV